MRSRAAAKAADPRSGKGVSNSRPQQIPNLEGSYGQGGQQGNRFQPLVGEGGDTDRGRQQDCRGGDQNQDPKALAEHYPYKQTEQSEYRTF
jgi:hypothetical protein